LYDRAEVGVQDVTKAILWYRITAELCFSETQGVLRYVSPEYY